MIKEYNKQLSPLPYKWKVVVYDNPIDLFEKYKNFRFNHDPRDFQGGCFEFDDIGYLCILNNKKLNHGHIAHECKHLVNFAFRYCGIQLDIENDEVECYFLTTVVNEVYKHLSIGND